MFFSHFYRSSVGPRGCTNCVNKRTEITREGIIAVPPHRAGIDHLERIRQSHGAFRDGSRKRSNGFGIVSIAIAFSVITENNARTFVGSVQYFFFFLSFLFFLIKAICRSKKCVVRRLYTSGTLLPQINRKLWDSDFSRSFIWLQYVSFYPIPRIRNSKDTGNRDVASRSWAKLASSRFPLLTSIALII